jgi:hypothetical protein
MTPRNARLTPASCGWAWAAGPRSSSTPLTLSDRPRGTQHRTAGALGLDHYAIAMQDPEGNEFDIN